jgi:agmatine deiminase
MGECQLPEWIYEHLEVDDDPDQYVTRLMNQQREWRPELFRYTGAPQQPRMPGDFEPARMVLLSYLPHPEYERTYGDLIAAATTAGEVMVLVNDEHRSDFFRFLKRRRISPRAVQVSSSVPFDTVWMRDYGPVSVLTAKGPAFVDGRYFLNCLRDDAVPTRLAQGLRVPVFRSASWTEGGNLLSDGQGLCLTTTYFLAQNRRPEAELRRELRDYFGCRRTVVLEALVGNAVEHVDMFLYFASPETILLGQFRPGQDADNYDVLERNYNRLRNLRAPSGRPYEIIRVPMPDRLEDPIHASDGPLVRTYLNMLAFNDVVMVPVYDPPGSEEREALRLIGQAFPSRRIVPIVADGIANDGGTVHCITQTLPAWP